MTTDQIIDHLLRHNDRLEDIASIFQTMSLIINEQDKRIAALEQVIGKTNEQDTTVFETLPPQ